MSRENIKGLFYKLGLYEGSLKHMTFILYLTVIACMVQKLLKFLPFYKSIQCKTFKSLAVHIW